MASQSVVRQEVEANRPDIARAWSEAGYDYPGAVRKLMDLVTPQEQVLMMTSGDGGFVVATNRRVLFLYAGLTKRTVIDFPYDRITAVASNRGLLYSNLLITAAGPYETFEKLNKSQADKLAALIRDRVEAVTRERAEPSAAKPQCKSVTTELRELAELRDSGILTDEEFQDQKRRLLND